MEKASAAALRKEMDLHLLKLFHNTLNLAIREAVPTARRFTCKARRAMRIKCKKRQQMAKLKEELDELASDVDEEEVEKKAEQLAELGRFCGELPACDSKAAELVFARIRDVFGKDDRGQMAALRKPGGCDERPLFAETAVTKAEVLADIYAEVGEGTTAAAEEPSVGEELLETDAEISVAEVREALRAQPDGKAAGLDGVNCEPLKHLGDNGVLLLHRIFCLVYENGEWPRGWAMACIVPILKMGKDPSLGGSYRPVSLTSVLAKLCERVIGGRLKHVTQRCISDSQAGFRRGRGTAEHLAACQLRLAAHTARGRFSAMLCADLSRAFDRVDHNLLLGRLGGLGVRGRLWRVLRAFLHKRMARVRVDGEFSETRAMKAGVPQGTILAPMLFVLFVDDLARRMDALDLELHFLAYADDVAFLVSADSRSALEERVAKGLAVIEEWAEELRLMLSREKTVVLARNPSGDAVELDVDFRAAAETAPEKLRCVDSLRYLGLVFKAKANPLADFLEEATARSYARLTTLRVLAASQWASTQLLRTVYLGYVLGTSRYGIALADASGLTELKAMHRKALRLVTGCHPSTPDAMLCAEAAIPPIEDIVREEAAKLRELLLRLPGNAPGRRACLSDHRAPTGWLSEAEKLAVRLRLDEFPREELQTLVPFAPWEQPSPTVIHTVPGCDRAREGELEVEAAARRLRSFFEAHEPPRLPKADLTICRRLGAEERGAADDDQRPLRCGVADRWRRRCAQQQCSGRSLRIELLGGVPGDGDRVAAACELRHSSRRPCSPAVGLTVGAEGGSEGTVQADMRGGHCGLEAPSPAEQARLRQGDPSLCSGTPAIPATRLPTRRRRTRRRRRASARTQRSSRGCRSRWPVRGRRSERTTAARGWTLWRQCGTRARSRRSCGRRCTGG